MRKYGLELALVSEGISPEFVRRRRQPLKASDQRERVLPAIIQQRLSDPVAPGLLQYSRDEQVPRHPSVRAVCYFHALVCHLGNQRRQNVLQ